MPLIVDGYNVLFAIGRYGRGKAIGEVLDEARQRLLAELVRHCQHTGEAATVVFDSRKATGGASRQDTLPGVRILYSHPPRTADDDILRLVEQSTAPRQLRVVTSDRELRGACARHGAEVVGARTFYRQLAALARDADADRREHLLKRQPPDDDELRYWLDVFGDDEPQDT